MERLWIAIAGASGATAVAAAAAARHGGFDAMARLDLETASQYGLLHAVALIALTALGGASGGLCRRLAAWCFVAGILLFCGSLYARAFGAPAAVIHATPVGGTLFIIGWVAVMITAAAPRRAR